MLADLDYGALFEKLSTGQPRLESVWWKGTTNRHHDVLFTYPLDPTSEEAEERMAPDTPVYPVKVIFERTAS